MKNYLVLIICCILFSCQNEEQFRDPNSQLLIHILRLNDHTNYYTYDKNNLLIESVSELSSGERYKYVYFYNDQHLCTYWKQFEVTHPDQLFSDSILYHMDDGYFIFGYDIFGSTTFYLDSLNRIFYKYHLGDSFSVYTEFINETTCRDIYLNKDSLIAGTIDSHFDNMKNPFITDPWNPFGNPHNIISRESENVDENGNLIFEFGLNEEIIGSGFPLLYTSTFEYNIQGYPTKETRKYSGSNNEETIYFEYIEAN